MNSLQEQLDAMTVRAITAEKKAVIGRKILVELSLTMKSEDIGEDIDEVVQTAMEGISEMDEVT